MKYILQQGDKFTLADIDSAQSKLPVGVYNISYNHQLGQVELYKTSDLTLPDKIYGDQTLVDRSIAVYKQRNRNFGLLMSGLKGSGKTLIMKQIAIKLNQPIIVFSEGSYRNIDEITEFLASNVVGDCTILLDEFDKYYNERNDNILTMLDGPYSTHHMFILTMNNASVNENMINRPGRIYYNVAFEGLPNSVIEAVANDLLQDKSKIQDLLNECSDLEEVSYDILLAIINDLNQFGDSVQNTMKWFNFQKPPKTYDLRQTYPNGDIAMNMALRNATLPLDPNESLLVRRNMSGGPMYVNLVDVEYEPISKGKIKVTGKYIHPDLDECDYEERPQVKEKLINAGYEFLPDSNYIKAEFIAFRQKHEGISY